MDKIATHYDSLKVARNSPLEVIRAAYRALCQKYHPDKYPDRERAERIMKVLNRAYEVLTDPVKRVEHDAWIAEQERLRTETRQQARGPARGTEGASEAGHGRARDAAPAETASSNNQTNGMQSAKKHNLHFVHVLAMCAVGGWFLAREWERQRGRLEFSFDAGFIGTVIAPALALSCAAMVGWIVGKQFTPIRKHASWVGLGLALAFFLALRTGGEIQEQRRLAPNASLTEPYRVKPNSANPAQRLQAATSNTADDAPASSLQAQPQIVKKPTYSVVANQVPVQELLWALARDAKINMDVHPGLQGVVSINAIDKTIPSILDRLSEQIPLHYRMDGETLIVSPGR